MELLFKTIKKIISPEKNTAEMPALKLQNNFAGDLPKDLEKMVVKLTEIMGTEKISLKKCIITAVADHGVAHLGVSAYPPETTIQMTRSYLIDKGAAVNVASDFCKADLFVVDVGAEKDISYLPGIFNKKIASGTQDITQGPAMLFEDAIKSIELGIKFATERIKEGYNCFSLSEMGIGNTTSNAAVTAVLCEISADEATGYGSGISETQRKNKVAVVEKAIAINNPDINDPLDVLMKLGGYETGFLVGVILAVAANRAVVIIDGFNSSVAALLAYNLQPMVKEYLLASQLSSEKAHSLMLNILELKPYLSLNMRIGESVGSAITIEFLEMFLSFLNKD
ncbi:nicotinate-nucleotide--dimethylbenzimidazole phosphoribosyltransferase [Selenomonadales bacterium OttesenSCG-928-I06]|nr:nicotinate-nucleotide--dimethylbenzimidazole phosphoribosyltransferase [Selenomonadales bacterium OttesenSCG-928-I06]